MRWVAMIIIFHKANYLRMIGYMRVKEGLAQYVKKVPAKSVFIQTKLFINRN